MQRFGRVTSCPDCSWYTHMKLGKPYLEIQGVVAFPIKICFAMKPWLLKQCNGCSINHTVTLSPCIAWDLLHPLLRLFLLVFRRPQMAESWSTRYIASWLVTTTLCHGNFSSTSSSLSRAHSSGLIFDQTEPLPGLGIYQVCLGYSSVPWC